MQCFHATGNRIRTRFPKETEVTNRETVSRVVFILFLDFLTQQMLAIMTQRKALQTRILKMENYSGFTAVFSGREDYESSRRPTASGKPEAVTVQKRGASAQRTQADHSRRKALCQVHLKSREHTGNWMQCFRQGATNRETSSRIPFFNSLIHQIGEDLFLRAIKIICLIQQGLNL